MTGFSITLQERERLTESFHSYLGFYITPAAEDDLAEVVALIVESRLEPVVALAARWLAEIEDTGGGLTELETVLDELRDALAAANRTRQGDES